MAKKESKIHAKVQKFSDRLGLIVAIITSLSAIGGAGVAACHWVVDTVSAQSNQRIDQLQSDMKDQQKKQEQATTRIELMQLMAHDPENVVEIELLAKKYFVDLSGDTYMTGVYSSWAKQYGGDTSFVLYH